MVEGNQNRETYKGKYKLGSQTNVGKIMGYMEIMGEIIYVAERENGFTLFGEKDGSISMMSIPQGYGVIYDAGFVINIIKNIITSLKHE